jgi:membrane-associated phospholipid phosphatase
MYSELRSWSFPILATLTLLLGIVATPTAAQESASSTPPDSTQSARQPHQLDTQTDRAVSLRGLPRNIFQDQKELFLFPKDLAKGKHWLPTIAIVGVTAGLVASDAHTAPTFRTTTRFHGFNNVFNDTNSAALIAVVPAAIYGVGLLRKDSYAQGTALLAVEAVADGFLLDVPFKGITGRKQPLNYTGNGPYSDNFFEASHNPVRSGGFYSMHASAAMAVATVIARRYRNRRWVPFVAYGLAGAISFSRISRNDHFSSDVFFGGAMGYVISRFVVLPGRN